jgi:hypothetical protein
MYADVYAGVPASIPVRSLAASCQPDIDRVPCDTVVTALNPGRFRVATSVPASNVDVTVDDLSARARARFLLLRSDTPGRIVVGNRGGTTDVLSTQLPAGERQVIGVPSSAAEWDRITFVPTRTGEPVVIDEIGFEADRSGLLRPSGQPFPGIRAARFYAVYVPLVTLAVCAFLVIAVRVAPAAVPDRFAPWLLAALCVVIGILELGTTFSPYWSRDLRSVYAAELIRSGSMGNMTGGLYEGSRLVQGLGETVPPGVVQWHRMPGYGLFCGLAAFAGRTTDVIDIAMIVILLQVLVYGAAVGIFVAAAQRLFGPWMAWLLGVLLAILPTQVANTQADALIAPIALLVLAAQLVYLAKERLGQATVRPFVIVNLAFALWFLMRNDVLPGWIAMSLVLAHRRWRLLAVPIVLIVMIALPWALYKRQYRHALDLMPTNTGEVMFLGLCEAPGTFPYACTDAGYFDWATRIGQADPTSSRASGQAVVEVLRHWITYPVHFAFMVWFKLRRSVYDWSWPGFQTPFNRPYILLREAGGFALLLAVAAVSVLVHHERRRTWVLGWALVFNMPLFFVVFGSAGRFNSAAGVSLIAAAIPPLFERGLYTQMARYPWRVVAVIACVGALAVGGARVERWIVSDDSLHYWAPLLDPQQSTLRFDSR